MGTAGVLLCVFVGCFVTADAGISEDGAFRPHFFENLFRFEENLDFPTYDTIFSSSRSRRPDFHRMGELPSVAGVPTVDVFCDDGRLTVLVAKRAGHVLLSADELQLGDGCSRSHDLPKHHVFAYGVDECGTTRVVDNGVEVFTNTLWINLLQPQAWRPLPSSVHLSCGHSRSFSKPDGFLPPCPDKGTVTRFNFMAMDASWTSPARSNVYERGQVIRFQVSATTAPEQQLFIQSCFLSASPDPLSRPRQAVVTNKGCAALLDSSHPAVAFVASKRPNVVHFVLNTSLAAPEPFLHCTVLISEQRLTSDSKSCNFDVTQLRWEELGGAREECECCRSKCRGLSPKTLPDEGKAVLSIGPFVVAEAKPEPLPEASAAPATDSMQSDGSAAVDWIVSGSAMSRSKFTGTPGDVVVVSPDPAATLALWLPGQLEDDSKEQLEGSRTNDLLEVANSVQKRESGTPQANEIGDSPVTIWQAKFGLFGKNPAAEAGPPLPPEMGGPNMEVLGQRQARPVIRSKLAFSRGRDGSQTLSYEEEVARKDEDDASSDCGMKNHRRRGLQSAFLDLIGRLNKAE